MKPRSHQTLIMHMQLQILSYMNRQPRVTRNLKYASNMKKKEMPNQTSRRKGTGETRDNIKSLKLISLVQKHIEYYMHTKIGYNKKYNKEQEENLLQISNSILTKYFAKSKETIPPPPHSHTQERTTIKKDEVTDHGNKNKGKLEDHSRWANMQLKRVSEREEGRHYSPELEGLCSCNYCQVTKYPKSQLL